MNIKTIVEALGLEPHPEGGFYKETYRSTEGISANALPERYAAQRDFSTAIYYLITDKEFSALHKVASDEMFHFYMGDPVDLYTISPEGEAQHRTIGCDVINGEAPQVLVKRNHWQGLKLKEGGAFALLGATVAPGFDFDDFEMATASELLDKYPDLTADICRFTRG